VKANREVRRLFPENLIRRPLSQKEGGRAIGAQEDFRDLPDYRNAIQGAGMNKVRPLKFGEKRAVTQGVSYFPTAK